MAIRRTFMLLLLASSLACDPELATAPTDALDLPSSADGALLFSLPDLSPDARAEKEAVARPEGAPAPIDDLDLFRAENQFAYIRGANTAVGFLSGQYAQAVGSHWYTGNVSSLSTTVHLTYQDAHVGSYTATTQRSEQLVTGLHSSFMLVEAKVYSDKQCGLEVQGNSAHSAHWATLAPNMINWGKRSVSSQATPKTNGDCGSRTHSKDPTGAHQAPAGMICYYLLTYDMDTGEVYEAELLYCESLGGIVI